MAIKQFQLRLIELQADKIKEQLALSYWRQIKIIENLNQKEYIKEKRDLNMSNKLEKGDNKII